ncbi:alpha-hydroxy acid oxidase [Zavarzinia compransoris]|uniref:Alpha-hydroxy-acid oxidizing enzyme n=1 Tax=Zavarzinia compransoris TaxID=1264899 RepID=A0A317E075_9PROT|nr:alpha-hydroxy acid oxidase [Zavarzinia compransoris]PWR20468.1 alpha-hydroxy-acid oxidizing enzyme [Zavarzinia compransoris]TDP43889.1 4-hydroxymandelate oxidase [Zavarzinia compransoris]
MTEPLGKLARIPPDIVAAGDYEPYALARMTAGAAAYLQGGAGDESTLRQNLDGYRRLLLRNRVLRDMAGGGTHLTLFGQPLAFPILLAPVAFQRLFHGEGEIAAARAAAAMGTAMVVSTQASIDLDTVARAAPTPLWFQLYIQPDRDFTRALVQRAEAAGYGALVVTVDAPVSGIRNREQRAGFALPPEIRAVNLDGMRPAPPHQARPGEPVLFGSPLLAAAPTFDDLARLKSWTRLPVLAKGITTAEDAAAALAAGIDGIIVSNHGGRVLDSQPATIDLLPAVAAAVAGRVPLLLDGGIRRGTDVLKALALGAAAVLIGRPYIHGLAAAGAAGVAHVLNILRAELEAAMVLTGCRDLAAIGPEILHR